MNSLVKYPRTPHLPWSLSGTSDDTRLFETAHFEGLEVVITEKLDGENTSLYRETMHARSLDGRHHESRDWVKALHARIAQDIPDRWRLCGENVYAQHSVRYNDLASYFYLFSVWNEHNEALSWDETVEWADLLGLVTAPVLYRGIWNEQTVRAIGINPEKQEGYVVRTVKRFRFSEFGTSIAKWVRQGHVQTDQHWMSAEIIPNRLASSEVSRTLEK